jgi:uncharacterized protein YdhG (YjbR/CyaY superfamily)
MNITKPNILEKYLPVLSKADIINKTERLVSKEGLGYAEAIIHICEKYAIEPEDIAKSISGSLKDKLKAEAQRNNYLPKPNNIFFE